MATYNMPPSRASGRVSAGHTASRGKAIPASEARIGVVICDKSPLVRSGLGQILADDGRFEIVASAIDGERFLEAVERFRFDIGVVGWDMPYLDGRGVLQALRERGGGPRIVIYTGNQALGIPRLAMQLGGAGFCSKSDPPERLVEILTAVHQGRMVFPFMDMRHDDGDPLSSLTVREHELLASLVHGNTNQQIAGELNISLNTVKFHLKNLYGKLGVQNRAQAVAQFLKNRAHQI